MGLEKPYTMKGEFFFESSVPININFFAETRINRVYEHKHDFIEIAYVYSGSGKHIIGNDKIPVAKGDIFIINYDIPHLFVRDEEEKEGSFILYNCIFRPEFLDLSLVNGRDFMDITSSLLFNTFFVEDKPAISLRLSEPDQYDIKDIYHKMHVEYVSKKKGYINILRSYLIVMLTRIFRALEEGLNNSNTYHCKYGIINKAIDFLKTNYSSNELNIEEVAIKSFFTRSYFSRLFKEITGHNFSEYLQNLRISEACLLLKTTDKKVTEILTDVGFRDIKHFNQIFKRITGKTPREYRKAT